jgi:BirA family transcriptional regulator, biotin operon repressor / biotin---[acetyl-CoA-carboxylase] ligase
MRELAIENPFPGAKAFLAETTASTQADAKALAAAGYPVGSLAAAEEQSAGRGRFPGRSWESEAGRNLLFTVYLGRVGLSALPIRIGLALRSAVGDYAASLAPGLDDRLKLKWPNDLMIGDRKVAGILCESGSMGAFAGLGLNCNQAAFPPALAARATSLALELGREVERWAILELFLERLAATLGAEASDEAWRDAADKALWRRGEAVSFLPGASGRSEGEPPLLGILEGIDAAGSILIRAEGDPEARSYPSGELTAGPAPIRVCS